MRGQYFTPEATMVRTTKRPISRTQIASNLNSRQQSQSKNRNGISGKKLQKPRMSQSNIQIAKCLAQFFFTIIELEKKIEIRREVIAEMAGFEPMQVYQTILKHDNNSRGSGVMSSLCLKRFLQVNNIKAVQDHLILDSDLKDFMQ